MTLVKPPPTATLPEPEVKLYRDLLPIAVLLKPPLREFKDSYPIAEL